MVRVQREKIQSVWKGIRGLKARVEWDCCISRGGRLNSRGLQPGGVHGKSYGGICRRSRDTARGGKLQE